MLGHPQKFDTTELSAPATYLLLSRMDLCHLWPWLKLRYKYSYFNKPKMIHDALLEHPIAGGTSVTTQPSLHSKPLGGSQQGGSFTCSIAMNFLIKF